MVVMFFFVIYVMLIWYPDFSLNPLQAFPERLNCRLVRGVTLRQHGHSGADIADIVMGGGELLKRILHEPRELGDVFLRLSYGLCDYGDVRRQGVQGFLRGKGFQVFFCG